MVNHTSIRKSELKFTMLKKRIRLKCMQVILKLLEMVFVLVILVYFNVIRVLYIIKCNKKIKIGPRHVGAILTLLRLVCPVTFNV